MPAKPLTQEQLDDAGRLRRLFAVHQAKLKDAGKPHSQLELADQLGFGQSALAQYLGGKIPLNPDVLLKLSGLLGVKPEAISPAIQAAALDAAQKWLAVAGAAQEVRTPIQSQLGPLDEREEALLVVWRQASPEARDEVIEALEHSALTTNKRLMQALDALKLSKRADDERVWGTLPPAPGAAHAKPRRERQGS